MSFSAVGVGIWSSWRKRGALFPQEGGEGGPNLRVVEEAYEAQPGKRVRELNRILNCVRENRLNG